MKCKHISCQQAANHGCSPHPVRGRSGGGDQSAARHIFVIHIFQKAHLNPRPESTWQGGKLSGTGRIKQTSGISWNTFRTFCVRSQLFLVQNQIAAIHIFQIRSKTDELLNMDLADKKKQTELLRSTSSYLEIGRSPCIFITLVFVSSM